MTARGRHLGRDALLGALALLTTAALAACGSEAQPSSDSATRAKPGARVTAVTVAKLDQPIALVPRSGDPDLWVAERRGVVRRLAVGAGGKLTVTGSPALDISSQTTSDVERGLLDIVFSPDGKTLYASYTDTDGDTRVDAYRVNGTTVDRASRKVLLAEKQPFPNHNGGNLEIGPDGRLWFGFGDGGAADDPDNRAQNPQTPLGKIVRVNPRGGKPEIVVSGVRNPWRFAFDTDGSLVIGDVGQNKTEEIDWLKPDQIEGANLGWSGYEGTTPYRSEPGRRPADAIGPVYEYSHADGNCSVTGGFVYHGAKLPQLRGRFLFADYCKGDLFALAPSASGKPNTARATDLKINVTSPISFGQDADGEPFVLSQTGAVVRLAPAD